MKHKLLAILFLFSFSCQRKVTNSSWVYAEGAYVGDVLDFKNGYYSVDDFAHIYRVDIDSIVGILVKRKGKYLFIKSNSGQKGVYRSIDLPKILSE